MARKSNPIGTIAKFGLLAVAAVGVVGGVKGYDMYKKKKAKDKKQAISDLSGVYAEGATVGAQPSITTDVLLPVVLSTKPYVRNGESGNIVMANTPTVASETMLHSLVTNLTPDAALVIYEYMLMLVATKGDMLTAQDVAQREKAVKETLSKVASKVDWSKGLQPYKANGPEYAVWMGANMLGEIAYQSFWNKQAAKG